MRFEEFKLHENRKNTRSTILVLPFIACILMAGTPHVGASPDTVVSLNPVETIVSAPGQNFMVDVNVTDVAGLYGFEFQLYYDTAFLDASNVIPGPVIPPTRFLGPVDPNTFEWSPINDTLGLVRVTCTFLSPASPFTGDGTLVTINFTATAEGTCILDFTLTQLFNNIGAPITHFSDDGSVTVIPEFPALLIVPLLLISTLAAALLGKTFWSRKRKDAL